MQRTPLITALIFEWTLRDHTGALYLAVLYVRARALIRSVSDDEPQIVSASLVKRAHRELSIGEKKKDVPYKSKLRNLESSLHVAFLFHFCLH